MSGICGIFGLDGRPVERDVLDRMRESLAHRGPDASGAWSGGAVGLGQCLLRTTAEDSHETAPARDTSGNLVLAADLRLDNREELIAALALDTAAPLADGALLLAAYERWGERCLEKLLGDFAFALWDARRQRLFCARDHFGVRPFFYHHSPGSFFAFGTEIKAVLCVPGVPRRLNEQRVVDYFIPSFDDKAATFYRDIHRLPPAHSLTVSREGIRIQPFWALDPEKKVRLSSDEEYAERFRELFLEAVRCRLRSAFPVGSLLSGGLDSSAVTCAARWLLPRGQTPELPTYSGVFDTARECDERPYIEAVHAQGGYAPHSVVADAIGPLADLETVYRQHDEPVHAPNLSMHRALYGLAGQQGVRVILDGLDGDSTVSHGFGHLTELARAGRLPTLAAESRALGKHFGVSPRALMWRHCAVPLASGLPFLPLVRNAWRLARRTKGGSGGGAPSQPLLRADAEQRIAAAGGPALPERMTPRDYMESARHYRSLSSGWLPYFMEVATLTAAVAGMEARFPFCDPRLAEFCLGLPAEQKLSGGWSRMVMRRALEGVLPEEIRWRPGKARLGGGFRHGLLFYDRSRVVDLMENDSSHAWRYVDRDALRASFRRYADGGEGEQALLVWRAVTLGLWLDQVKM